MVSAHPASGARAVVLVTRPEPAAQETARRLARLGFAPVLTPCLAVQGIAASLPPPALLQAVLVSSSHALAGLPAALQHLPLLAVGDATAARARAAGFAEVVSADGDAAALAALAGARCRPRGGALLLATGAGLGGELSAALRSRGFRVHRRVVYVSRPVARLAPPALHALRVGPVRAALFFSAETARAFVRALPDGLHERLACVEALAIGQAAAQALELLPWRRIRVAARPTQDELLGLLHE